MKLTYPCLTCGLLLSSLILSAQQGIRLKNGIIYPETNITESYISQFNTSARSKTDTSYILVQFKERPSQQQRFMLRQAGITLLQYIPDNAFTAQVTKPVDAALLQSAGLNSVTELKPEYKISSSLNSLQKNNQPIEVLVSFFETVPWQSAAAALTRQGFTANRYRHSLLNVAQVTLPGDKLFALAALPFVLSVEPLPPPPTMLNFRGRGNARSNVLQSRLPGAWRLDGEGVKIAIGEDWGIPKHIDYADREVNKTDEASVAHADHVHGIAAGAGLVNEYYTGNFHGQYYLGRSFTVLSQNALTDSVTMRLYFLSDESEALLFAENCIACKKPLHAYRFGISVYRSPQVNELNGNLTDNINGDWAFIPYQQIKIVPYLKGYYAEFRVKNLSELWLSNGGYDNNSPLPVRIPEFNATLLPSGDVELKWTTAAEININHFDVETAQGNEAFANNQFEKQDEANSKGASPNAQQYNFRSDGDNKTGVVYYRLKAVDASGNYSYSKARPIVFSNELNWVIAPNHSSGYYDLIFQANQGEKLNIEIYNSIGSLVRKEEFNGTGYITQHPIDLRGSYAKGVYLVRVQSKGVTRTFRIVKK